MSNEEVRQNLIHAENLANKVIRGQVPCSNWGTALVPDLSFWKLLVVFVGTHFIMIVEHSSTRVDSFYVTL